jgi:uncharacterized protein YlxW (UPF0749 family)
LEDPRAIPLLQTFASASKTLPEQPAAETSLETIRAARRPPDNLQELRESILDLQKENRQLRKDLEDLQKKLESTSAPRSAKPKR